MGFEAITLVVESASDEGDVMRLFDSLGFQKVVGERSRNTTHLECVRPHFIVEASISAGRTGGTDLRIELALCNPPQGDHFFTDAVKDTLSLGPFRVWFMTSLQPGLSFDSAKDSPEDVVSALGQQVVGLRANWQSVFGDKSGPVRIADAYAFVGVA